MLSICSPEAEESAGRDEEDLLTGSSARAFPKCQMDGEQLGPLVLGNHRWVYSGASQYPSCLQPGWQWVDTYSTQCFWAAQGVDNPIRTLVNRPGL